MLKVVFFPEIFNFLSWIFGSVGKCFIRKPKFSLISKSTTSQNGLQIITTQILLTISRCKDSQTIKLGRLMKYNMSNIFNNCYIENKAETNSRLPVQTSVIFYHVTKIYCVAAFTSRNIGDIMCIVISSGPVCDVIKHGIKIKFSVKPSIKWTKITFLKGESLTLILRCNNDGKKIYDDFIPTDIKVDIFWDSLLN